jgi:hypothetical protein
MEVVTMSKSSQIIVESLVVDVECPNGCLACAEVNRERQDRRERILAAQAALLDEPVLSVVATVAHETSRLAA